MKLKISIAIIVLSSIGFLGLAYVTIDRIGSDIVGAAKSAKGHNEPFAKPKKSAAKSLKSLPKRAPTSHDEQIIIEVAAMEPDALTKEILALRQEIETKDLFNKLEQKALDEQSKEEAKDKLLRLSLLSLEGTRRKYLAMEPELSDPLYAHRDSLINIRTMLSRY